MSGGRHGGISVRRSWQFRNGLGLDGFDGAPVLIHLYSDLLPDRNTLKHFRFDDLKKQLEHIPTSAQRQAAATRPAGGSPRVSTTRPSAASRPAG